MFSRRNLFKSLLGFLVVPKELPAAPKVQRRLKVNWSIDAEQDLMAMHNALAESQLAAIMAEEIQKEIDNKMINRMIECSKKMPI